MKKVIYCDPVEGLINLCVEKYNVECIVGFNKRVKNYGRTSFFKGCIPKIELSTKINIIQILDTLAHEIAHVIRGVENMDHGKEWRKIYNDIYRSYCGRK